MFGKSDSGSSPPSQVACDAAVPPASLLLLSPALAEGENLRHRCRNPQCRAKLPVSATNAREAFCCCGCHAFFRTRCRVCEQPIEQPARGGTRLICKRAMCKSAWRSGLGFGRYHHSVSAKSSATAWSNRSVRMACRKF